MDGGGYAHDRQSFPAPKLEAVNVIPRLYDAAVEPAGWSGALEAAAELLQAAAVLLQCGPPSAGLVRIIASSGLSADLVAAYNRDHIGGDELLQEALVRPAGMLISSRLALDDTAFERSCVYRNLLRPAGLLEMAGTAFVKEPDLFAGVWMARGAGSPAFSETEYQLLRQLLPHMERAVTVRNRVAQAEQLAELTAGAFDRVAMGVVLLDALGRPLLTNREARHIGADDDGFAILKDGPAAARHDDTTTLRAAIRKAGGADGSTSGPAGKALRLARPSGRSDYQVVVLPLPRRCQPADAGGVVAVLFVTDPERSHSPIDHLVGDLFGLTEAEVRLVMQLLGGSSLTDAAETLGLSRNTVHSQLSSVFRKTGTRRQSELVKLVLQALAPVRGPDDSSGFHLPPDDGHC